MKNNDAKILFKYIGGKTWLKDKIRKPLERILKNNKIEVFIEPFAGGLGCFLNIYDLLEQYKVKKIILNDINKKVINFYKSVYKNPEKLIYEYEILENDFISLVPYKYIEENKIKEKESIKILLSSANEYFIKTRKLFNSCNHDDERAAALFLFLQTHCFNGVYRENQKGEYNTPFNWGVKKFDSIKFNEKIFSVHNIFNMFDIEFLNKSYTDIDYTINHSLYYADPPYINKDGEIKENKYHQDGFNTKDQLNLIDKLSNNNFIYSNHDNELLISNFENKNKSFIYEKINRKNIMSASNESRKIDKVEILISSE